MPPTTRRLPIDPDIVVDWQEGKWGKVMLTCRMTRFVGFPLPALVTSQADPETFGQFKSKWESMGYDPTMFIETSRQNRITW